MKNSFCTFLGCLFLLSFAQGQSYSTPEPDRPRKHLIIGGGISFQWFDNPLKLGYLQVETPIGEYQHLGIMFTKLFSGSNYDYYNLSLEKGFEVGINFKYFLHGRFTGRKTGFYLGPDIRFGKRTYRYNSYDFMTGGYTEVDEVLKSSKIMLAWGVQWHFGQHVIFELSVPTGYESLASTSEYPSNGYYNSFNNTVVFLPSLTLGVAF
jgi:hypothetical protein